MSKVRDFLDHITWPQVAALGLALAGLLGLAALILPHIPADAWSQIDLTQIGIALGGLIFGGAGLAAGPGILRKRPQPAESVAQAPRRVDPPSRQDGSVPDVVLAVLAVCSTVALALWPMLRAWLPALLLSVGLAGCGAQLTTQQRTDLATETQRCLIAEREIVDSVGTTAAQDAADLAAERARCDAARAAIVERSQP